MRNQIPLSTYISTRNPISLAARQLDKEMAEITKAAGQPEATQSERDNVSIGFLHGCSFVVDLFSEILDLKTKEISDFLIATMILKINNERARLAEQAAETLDRINKGEKA